MDEKLSDLHFEYLLRGSGDQETKFRNIYACIAQLSQDDSSGKTMFRALDRNIVGKGGYAFLWSDLLSIDSLLLDLVNNGLDASLEDMEIAKLIVTVLLNKWAELRRIRVELNENEFKVLLAIKRGNTNILTISTFSDLQVSEVTKIMNGLKCREYKESITLVEENNQGIITTCF